MRWLSSKEGRGVAYGVAAAAALVPRLWMLDFESGDFHRRNPRMVIEVAW